MRQVFALAAIFAFCLMPMARAEEGSERSEGASRSLIRDLIEKFDANGDGKLTGEEREAARRALAERREQGGRDGQTPPSEADGPRREGDRPVGAGDRPRGEGDRPRTEGDRPKGEVNSSAGDRPPTREEILAKFDEDGNGKLEGAELVKARADAQRRRDEAREREQASRPDESGIRLTVDQQRQLLREFDRNRDGKLTGEEAERALRFAREKWGSGGGPRGEGAGGERPGPGGDRRGGEERPGPGGGGPREGGERRGPGPGAPPPRPPR